MSFLSTIGSKIKSFLNWEDPNHPNQNGTKIIALINLAAFVIGILLPWISNHTVIYTPVFALVEVVLLGFTIYSFDISIKDTFETHEPWKVWLQAASVILDIVVPAIFISTLYSV